MSKERDIEPWYWGYLFQGAVILGIAPIILPIVVAQVVSNTQLGNLHAGIVVAAFYLGQFPAPWIGNFAEKTGKFALIYLFGYVLIGIGCLLFPLTQNLIFWILLALLLGLGAGASNTLTAMYVVEFNPKEQWDTKIGWLQTVYGTGQALGLLVVVAMLQADPLWALLLGGILMLPGLLLGRIGLPKDPIKQPAKQAHSDYTDIPHHVCHHGLHPFSLLGHYQQLVKMDVSLFFNRFGLYLLSWFCVMFGMWMVMNLLPLFFQDNYGISASLSSLYYGIFAVVGIFFYAPSGVWASRFGSSRVLFAGIVMLVLSLGGLALLTEVSNSSWQYLLAPVAFFLIPAGWSPLIVAGTSLASEITIIGRGEGLGLFNAVTAIAAVLSAIASGKVAADYGYGMVAIIAAIIGFFGLLLFLPLVNTAKPGDWLQPGWGGKKNQYQIGKFRDACNGLFSCGFIDFHTPQHYGNKLLLYFLQAPAAVPVLSAMESGTRGLIVPGRRR